MFDSFKNLYDFMKSNKKYSVTIDFEMGEAVHLFKFESSLDNNIVNETEYFMAGHFGFMKKCKIDKHELNYPYTLLNSGRINHLDEFYYLRNENVVHDLRNQFSICSLSEYDFWKTQRLFSAAESEKIRTRLEDSIKLWMVMNV